MKSYFLTLVFLFLIFYQIGSEPIQKNYIDLGYIKFLEAYVNIRRWEGNYSYLKYDKGGETYGGISRNYNQDWDGWDVLDKLKGDSAVEWNKHIPEMEEHVIDYYYNIWKSEGYYLIKEPLVANYVFDYRNTGPVALRHIQEVLVHHGYNVKVNMRMNIETINAINDINPIIFILHLREVRREYYERIVLRRPEMEIYLKGWINRANAINSGTIADS